MQMLHAPEESFNITYHWLTWKEFKMTVYLLQVSKNFMI